MVKMRFPLVAGILVRGQVRNQLYKVKSDIEWKIDGAKVSIDESKGLLNSTFYVLVENVDEVEARVIKRSIEDWVSSCQ